LISHRPKRIGRTLDITARHCKRFVPQQVADKERVRTGLRCEGACGVAKVMRAKISEPCTRAKVAPACSEGLPRQLCD
jgi:hypothetical protein